MSEPRRPATYDDLRALPENVVGELIGGHLVTHPRPASPHACARDASPGERCVRAEPFDVAEIDLAALWAR